MNWKWFIGSRVNSAMHWTVSRSVFPLTRYLPRGWSWLYDVQRFSETKSLRIAFDIGANVGQTVGGLQLYFPRASIYCFEPVSSSFAKLASFCAPFPNVKCVQKALGSSGGTGVIQLHRNSELNTLVSAGPRMDDLEGISETVSIDTVDSFCAAEGIDAIDILKMDVQGWEMEVLKGARELIGRRKIHFVYSEVGFRRDDADMQHVADLSDFMEASGFRLCGFYNLFRWGEKKEFLGFANALYVNTEFRDRD